MADKTLLFSWSEPHDRRQQARPGGFSRPTLETFARLYDTARRLWPGASIGFVQREDVTRGRAAPAPSPWQSWGKGKGWPLTRGVKATFWRGSLRDFPAGEAMLEGLLAVQGEDPFVWIDAGGTRLVLLGSCLHEAMLGATDAVPHHEAWCKALREAGMVESPTPELASSLLIPSPV